MSEKSVPGRPVVRRAEPRPPPPPTVGRPRHRDGAEPAVDPHGDKSEALAAERYVATQQSLLFPATVVAVALLIFLGLAIPTHGWLPLLAIAVPAAIGPLTHAHSAGLPERVYAISHTSWVVVIGVVAAATGGADSFLLPLLAAMTLTFFGRLPPRVATVYSSLAFAGGCVPVVVTDWDGLVASPWLLGSCVVGMVSLSTIAGRMAAGEIEQRGEATLDQLTGLLNRRGLDSRLAELSQQAVVLGDDTPLALIACDLDHFKAVNDTFGHARGDGVLREVAYLLRKELRRFELAYRMGGEEFLVVLPGYDVTAAAVAAERIRAAIETARPGGVDVTISMGVAVGRAADGDGDELLEQADAAVYAAKRAGRNRVVVSPPRPARPSQSTVHAP